MGCDGVHSVVRERLIGDPHRVSGHVVYRAVVPRADMPADLRWNAAAIWGRPELPSRPLSAARRRAVQHRGHVPQPDAGAVGRARGLARRGHVVLHRNLRPPPPTARQANLVGSAGRPPTAIRSSAGAKGGQRCSATPRIRCCNTWRRGACIALEDAVTLREALRACEGDLEPALRLYESRRIVRGARLIISAREMDGSITPRASSGWCATRFGPGGRRSGFTTRSNGSTAGRSKKCLA